MVVCVCVFSGVGRWGSSLNAYPGITSWQEEWEVSSQTGCIKASLEASCGCLCQTEGGTVLIQPALPRGRDTVVTDLTYPTVHTVISMVNKSAEILSFPAEVSGKCVHCHCLSTANELCSSLKAAKRKRSLLQTIRGSWFSATFIWVLAEAQTWLNDCSCYFSLCKVMRESLKLT